MHKWASPLLIVGLVIAIGGVTSGVGCSETRACYEGDFEACTCSDGREGFAACDVAKGTYGACGSCGDVPGLTTSLGGGGSAGGGGAGGAMTSSAKLGFLESCEKDEDCESGICHVYTAKGPRCTLACQTAADCPSPSPGCNNMGFCKVP